MSHPMEKIISDGMRRRTSPEMTEVRMNLNICTSQAIVCSFCRKTVLDQETAVVYTAEADGREHTAVACPACRDDERLLRRNAAAHGDKLTKMTCETWNEGLKDLLPLLSEKDTK
jgi:RNase P subunit RPR2